MKKITYFLFVALLASCSNKDDVKNIIGKWQTADKNFTVLYSPNKVTATTLQDGKTFQHSGSWTIKDGILIENINGKDFYSKYRFEEDSLILRFSMSNKDIRLNRTPN